MSHTSRAIDKAFHAPHTLTPAEREFTRGIRPAWESPWPEYNPPFGSPDNRDWDAPGDGRSLPPEEEDEDETGNSGGEKCGNSGERIDPRTVAMDFVW